MGGGGGSGTPVAGASLLTVADVQQAIAQAVAEAQARNAKATIAIVDRVGNVLGVFRMTGAATTFTITSGTGAQGGLEGLNVLPPEFAAISKAVTGAYLSSAGNAFSTRTAGQIVQQTFQSRRTGAAGRTAVRRPVQPAPVLRRDPARCGRHVGPKRSPLGLAADPGGLPLYKNGAVVGGVGVMADRLHGRSRRHRPRHDLDEVIAIAGSDAASPRRPIAAPTASPSTAGPCASSIRVRIAQQPGAERRRFAASTAPTGTLVAVPGYGGSPMRRRRRVRHAGVRYPPRRRPAVRGLDAYVLVDDANADRYPPQAGTDGLLAPRRSARRS